MLANFDEMQKFGKDNVEATLRSLGAASKGFQALAAEVRNYSKKSFEDGTAAVERLMGAKTLEKAIEVQAEYAKSAYEGFVAQATKIGELYADIAKESYKPFEGYLAKVTPSK
jgi:phasin family protein